MKRVAVLISGLLRQDFKECLESFKENLVKHNEEFQFDYYLCFWDCDNNADIDAAIKLCHPKAHLILNFKEHKQRFLSSEFKHVFQLLSTSSIEDNDKRILNSFLMQMYSLKRCHELFSTESFVEYDYVFKNRYDFIYHTPSLLPEIADNHLHILRVQGSFIFVDNICIGKPYPTSVYMNSYNSLVDETFLSTEPKVRNLSIQAYGYTPYRDKNFKLPYNSPERIFEEHLYKNNVKFVKSLKWKTWAINRAPPAGAQDPNEPTPPGMVPAFFSHGHAGDRPILANFAETYQRLMYELDKKNK